MLSNSRIEMAWALRARLAEETEGGGGREERRLIVRGGREIF